MKEGFYIYLRPKVSKVLVVLGLVYSVGMLVLAYSEFKAYLAPTNFIISSSKSLSLLPPLAAIFFWLLFIFPLVYYFLNQNRLIINTNGLSIMFGGKTYYFGWNEVSKIGIQALVSPKSLGIMEIFLYLAINLKDKLKINDIKNHKEFDLIQKKDDLKNFRHQEDILDLYVSLRFTEDSDPPFLDFLKNKSTFVEHLKPLVRTDSEDEYNSVLKENFNL